MQCYVTGYHGLLTGLLPLGDLPPNLLVFNVKENHLNGEVDLSHLPESLFTLDLSRNGFSGALHFSDLPPSITNLDLSNNQFSGTPSLMGLPVNLNQLGLRNNLLSGIIDLTPVIGENWNGASPPRVLLSGNSFEEYLMPHSLLEIPPNIIQHEPAMPQFFF